MLELRKKRFKIVEKLRSFLSIFSKEYGKTSIEPRGPGYKAKKSSKIYVGG